LVNRRVYLRVARLSRSDDPRRFVKYSYPHSIISEGLILAFEELKFLYEVAGRNYMAAASLVNPALDVKQSLRNLNKAEYGISQAMPPYFKFSPAQVADKGIESLVQEFHRRKEELEAKARDFKPQM